MDFKRKAPVLTSEGFSMKDNNKRSKEERKATFDANTSKFYSHIIDSLDSDRQTQNQLETSVTQNEAN